MPRLDEIEPSFDRCNDHAPLHREENFDILYTICARSVQLTKWPLTTLQALSRAFFIHLTT